MVWFRVDDRFHGSDPVKKIPREQRAAAIGLWTMAGTWSAQFLKDGFVPRHMLEDFCGSVELADELVKVGLWKKSRTGFHFTNWEQWQPTREQITQKREAAATRSAEYRAKRLANMGDGDAPVTHDEIVSHAPVHPSRPDPTRPDPTTSKEVGTRKRATRIPQPFVVTPAMVAWAKERVPAVDGKLSTERFVNHWLSKSGKDATKLDWERTWHNWLLTDAERVKATPTQKAMRTMALASDLVKELE